MNEKKSSEFTQLADPKKKKKRIIISAIALAMILLLVIYLLLFRPFIRNNQPQDQDQGDASSEQSDAEEPDTEEPGAEEPDTEEPAPEQKEDNTDNAAVQVQSGSALRTGYEPLDTLANNILSNITYGGMTATAKLEAIYNYVRRNMSYNMFSPTEGIYDELIALGYSVYDSSQMALAYDAATYYQGVCDHYSALTLILARAAGIPLYQSGGLSAQGSSHAWNVLLVDGEKYLVDATNGIFMKRFSESGFTEQMDGSNYFNYFNTSAPPIEEKKISWMFNAGFEGQRFMGNTHGEVTQNATIDRPWYPDAGTLYPAPITPTITAEGENNTFSATVSSGGAVIETLKSQSGENQMYYFSWYPPGPGSYVIEITASSDDIFTGHFFIYAEITE